MRTHAECRGLVVGRGPRRAGARRGSVILALLALIAFGIVSIIAILKLATGA